MLTFFRARSPSALATSLWAHWKLSCVKILRIHHCCAVRSSCPERFCSVTEMGLKTTEGVRNTAIIGLFLLAPLAVLIITIVIFVKCASCCENNRDGFRNRIRDLWMKVPQWRYFGSSSRKTSERSSSSSVSIAEDSRDVELGDNRSQIR